MANQVTLLKVCQFGRWQPWNTLF